MAAAFGEAGEMGRQIVIEMRTSRSSEPEEVCLKQNNVVCTIQNRRPEAVSLFLSLVSLLFGGF